MKLRHYMLQEDTKKKFKKDPRVQDDESDMEDDWIAEHEESLRLKEREKVEKKFAKENEKAVADGNAEMKPGELKSKLADVDADFKRIKKETKAKKGSMKNPKPLEKLEENLDKMTAKITQMKLQALDRDEGKEVALGTSKINYLDPRCVSFSLLSGVLVLIWSFVLSRITAAWCAAHDVPIEKIFSKTLLTKFPWALEVEQDWKF
jgi:DNA topoisomerase I